MKIQIITPTLETPGLRLAVEELLTYARFGVALESSFIETGFPSIESRYEEAVNIPSTLQRVQEAEELGFDAIIINCMADPGLYAARELVDIPIVGVGQTAFHLAAMLGHRFSVIPPLERNESMTEEVIARYGLESRLASVRAANIPVLDLKHGEIDLADILFHTSVQAIEEDDAHVIVLGCTGMAGIASQVGKHLATNNYRVPVIDPGIAALKLTEALVDMRISHSKRTYPRPPAKELVGY